jgi:hypothetical protein
VKLVLDEHVPSAIARELRVRGHDVITAVDLFTGRDRGDEVLLEAALAAGRAIVTSDVGDFAHLHRVAVLSGRGHAGLVFFSQRRFPTTARGIGRLVDALDALLVAHPGEGELASQCVWLEAPASVQP